MMTGTTRFDQVRASQDFPWQAFPSLVALCLGVCWLASCGSLRTGTPGSGGAGGGAGRLGNGSGGQAGSQDAAVDPQGDADSAMPLGGTGGGGGPGGNSGSGGRLGGSGGATLTGGAPGSGGAATGGTGNGSGSGGRGTGGAAGMGTGGGGGSCTTRDCSSDKDNDCNSLPDNQEAPCRICPLGGSQACSSGRLGICAAGLQMCQLAADHQSVGWGTCLQTAAQRSRDCTSSSDNDCNGQADNTETTFCQCSPALSPQACSTGMMGICAAGSQVCNVSGDKSSSAWGTCTQLRAKGVDTCLNPGTDDDCDGIVDNVPVAGCNVGTGQGACANGGFTACNGTTVVCNAAVVGIGDPTVLHTGPAPNGSWDWDCDGIVTKEFPDAAPPPPTCTGLTMDVCSAQPILHYALTPFACGDLGDVGELFCGWLAAIPGCVNKSGQGTGFQQRCR